MLHELSEWEEQQRSRDLLDSGRVNLNAQRVVVYNVQNAASWISGAVSAHNTQTKAMNDCYNSATMSLMATVIESQYKYFYFLK